MHSVIDWLLEGPPWIQYRTRKDLLEQPDDSPEMLAARQAMLANPQIQSLLSELTAWPGTALKRHNEAGHLLHKLVFAAELGIRNSDPDIDKIVNQILEQQSPDGAFQILVSVSATYGGSGNDQWAWMLCDTPSILYSLTRLGLQDDSRVKTAARHLAGLASENGWHCTVSPELGKFRGPGRKDDPCPYATLLALKALSQIPEWRDSAICKNGAETLLSLWEQRKQRRPYLFAMGTDFSKLKAPLIWYDVLHMLDVLTQFPWLHNDRRLLEMVNLIRGKMDADGRFTAESAWKAWANWEFGQKREPSLWVTLLAKRILKRVNA